MLKTIAALFAAGVICQPCYSADLDTGGRVRIHRGYAWRDHHIIEVAIHPPGSRAFIINGAHFAAKSDACLGWEAGDRIALVSGEWHGYCTSAVFRNLSRGRTCEMWCGYYAGFR